MFQPLEFFFIYLLFDDLLQLGRFHEIQLKKGGICLVRDPYKFLLRSTVGQLHEFYFATAVGAIKKFD
jgi:hypothetical protein